MFRSHRPSPHKSRSHLKLLCVATGVLGAVWAGAQASYLPPPTLSPTFEVDDRPHATPAPAGQARCADCHRFEPTLTHPVNVRPSMAVPAALPLQDGLMTCNTCHDGGGHAESGLGPVAARVTAGLCVQCHQPGTLKGRSMHTQAVGRAHLLKEMPRASRGGGSGLDTESKACMGCHDGMTASDAGAHSVRRTDVDPPSDHPIGILMRASSRTQDGDFRLASPNRLDRRIRLFDGAVGCGSCHSVYSKERSHLVMSNRGSALCLNCHTQ